MGASSEPGAPTLDDETTITYDELIEDELEEAREELEECEFDTELGLQMAEDAKKVSKGEMTGDEFWEKYDELAREEFGEHYESSPNPAVDRANQTVCGDTASSLSCSTATMSDVAENIDDTLADADSDEPQWGMVIDLQKCIGCESCTVACKAEKRTPPGVTYNVVKEQEHGEFPNVTRTNLPRPCLQCQDPPCVQVCPVAATWKMENGVTTIDYDRCIGCRYCLVGCPYGARYFDFGEDYDDEFAEGDVTAPEYGRDDDSEDSLGTAMKCSYCTHRLERGEEPSCVETCIGDARFMGDLSDPESEVSEMASKQRAFRLKEGEGTNPNMYYLK